MRKFFLNLEIMHYLNVLFTYKLEKYTNVNVIYDVTNKIKHNVSILSNICKTNFSCFLWLFFLLFFKFFLILFFTAASPINSRNLIKRLYSITTAVSTNVTVTKARVAKRNNDSESMNCICGGISFYKRNNILKFYLIH